MGNVILVFNKGCLHAVSSIDGKVLWEKDFSAESIEVQQIIQHLGSDIIYAVGFVGSSQLALAMAYASSYLHNISLNWSTLDYASSKFGIAMNSISSSLKKHHSLSKHYLLFFSLLPIKINFVKFI